MLELMDGTVTAHLRQCGRCGYWSRWQTLRGLCGNCALGWTNCIRHGRLEWEDGGIPEEDGGHRRVSIRDVLQSPLLKVVSA